MVDDVTTLPVMFVTIYGMNELSKKHLGTTSFPLGSILLDNCSLRLFLHQVAAGLDVSLAAAAGAVVSGAYFGDKISPLSDSTNFAAIVADTTLFEHIQHLLWTTLPSFLLAAVVYLIAGHSNMLGEVATPQRVTDIIHSLESLYHFNIVLILPPVIVLWGAIRKKPVIPLMLSACVLALFLGVIMQGLSIKQGLDAFIDGFDIAISGILLSVTLATAPANCYRCGFLISILPARLRFRRHCISESSTAYLAIANVMRHTLTPCFTGFCHATSSR